VRGGLEGWAWRRRIEDSGIGEAAVRSHVSAILRKLQMASRTQAALYALREGLASLYDADLPP